MTTKSVDDLPSVQSRLCEVLRVEVERSGYKGLAAEIEAANPRRRKVDRRKLSALADGRRVLSWTMDELEAIHYFLLLRNGSGLGGLFAQPLVRSLAERENVLVLIGGKRRPAESVISISQWDVRAVTALFRSMFRPGSRCTVDIWAAPFFSTKGYESPG